MLFEVKPTKEGMKRYLELVVMNVWENEEAEYSDIDREEALVDSNEYFK